MGKRVLLETNKYTLSATDCNVAKSEMNLLNMVVFGVVILALCFL